MERNRKRKGVKRSYSKNTTGNKKKKNKKQKIIKEKETVKNKKVKRRNPATEEKIMLNIPYQKKPYISSGFPN
jgi:hypothetical protein